MPNLLRVLIIEDSEDDAFFTVQELARGGFEPEFERVETWPPSRPRWPARFGTLSSVIIR